MAMRKLPPLCDLHVHGGAGHDFMAAALSNDSAGLAAIARHLAGHGVSQFLATTVTAPWEATLTAVERLAGAGFDLHLEGPYLSPVCRGVHPAEFLRLPTLGDLEALGRAAGPRLRMITLAPELEGALEFIRAATERGICISVGHSDATLEEARAGVAAGARHVTHCFNAMRPLQQREPGLLGLALADSSLSTEVIADGYHVDPLLVGHLLRTKAPGKSVLVTDGISATGCGDGRYILGGLEVEVAGGRCMHAGRLAGSVLTLDQAVENAARFAGVEVEEAAVWASENPRKLIWTNL